MQFKLFSAIFAIFAIFVILIIFAISVISRFSAEFFRIRAAKKARYFGVARRCNSRHCAKMQFKLFSAISTIFAIFAIFVILIIFAISVISRFSAEFFRIRTGGKGVLFRRCAKMQFPPLRENVILIILRHFRNFPFFGEILPHSGSGKRRVISALREDAIPAIARE